MLWTTARGMLLMSGIVTNLVLDILKGVFHSNCIHPFESHCWPNFLLLFFFIQQTTGAIRASAERPPVPAACATCPMLTVASRTVSVRAPRPRSRSRPSLLKWWTSFRTTEIDPNDWKKINLLAQSTPIVPTVLSCSCGSNVCHSQIQDEFYLYMEPVLRYCNWRKRNWKSLKARVGSIPERGPTAKETERQRTFILVQQGGDLVAMSIAMLPEHWKMSPLFCLMTMKAKDERTLHAIRSTLTFDLRPISRR